MALEQSVIPQRVGILRDARNIFEKHAIVACIFCEYVSVGGVEPHLGYRIHYSLRVHKQVWPTQTYF